jgi:hypothetical protein
MVATGNLLNARWKDLYRKYYLSEDEVVRQAETERTGKISYDY